MSSKSNAAGLAAAAISGVLLVAALRPVQAEEAAKPTDPAAATLTDIQACINRNLVNRGALRDLNVTVSDREQKSHGLRMKLYWKPSPQQEPRINLRLLEPLAMNGSSYLLLQNGAQEEIYFHIPSADRALRITGKNMSEPLWGTDFSYGEIKQVLGLVYTGDTQRLPDEAIAGRTSYVLETDADVETSGYVKVLSYVDQATCVLLKSEFRGKNGQPVKLLTADPASLLTVDEYSVVLDYTMSNPDAGSSTRIQLSDFTLMEHLPERMFDPQRFFEPFE